MATRATRARALVRSLVDKAVADRVTGLAAEVAFWSVLSLAPAALVLAALLGLAQSVLGSEVATRAEDRILEVLRDALGSGGDGVVSAIEGLFAQPNPGLLSVALLLALWTGSRVMAALSNALDVIAGSHRRRSWLARRLWGVALGLGSVAVFAGLVVALVVVPIAGNAAGGALAGLVAAVVVVAWLAVVFSASPSVRQPLRAQLRGAAVAAALVVVFTVGLRVYLAVQAGNVVVAGLGGILVALLWLYLLGLALLVGAVVNQVWSMPVRAAGRRPGGGGASRGAAHSGTAYAGEP